ncbi:triose-phosphate isomerase [Patescibacteria group bacterium]|nr:triose-phosphate isomerase [Patescibacteria group bacterium]
MRKPLVVANWKAFIESPERGLELIRGVIGKLPREGSAHIVVCPPDPLIAHLRAAYRGARLAFGAQNISLLGVGPYTGESPAALLKASGATYVILGHAERRALGENDDAVAQKVRIALEAKLTPILCIGERERDASASYLTTIEAMVPASLRGIDARELKKIVIAYEPVWAIGAASAPGPRVVAEALLFIRKTLVQRYGREYGMQPKLIYGGAVDATSAPLLLAEGGAEGFLVGRASTDVSEFIGIIRACESKPSRRSRTG